VNRSASPYAYVGPAFEEARVFDAMRVGVVSCRPQTPLVDVARMMIGYGIHSVVVSEMGRPDEPWGLVADLDLVTAVAEGLTDGLARDVASTELITIRDDEPLEHAAQMMSEHGLTHLIAVQPTTGRPVGVISALALVGALAPPIVLAHGAVHHPRALPPMAQARVADVMRVGVLSCAPETSLRDLAQTMASHRVHCVVITDVGGEQERAWGIASDLDVAASAGPDADRRSAREVARTSPVTVEPDTPVVHAAHMMADNETTHLVVVEGGNGAPTAVVSTLDIAAVLAASTP
jgi:CBS domain-containing protein